MLGTQSALSVLGLLQNATSETRSIAIQGLLDVLPESLVVLLEARQTGGEAGRQIDAALEALGPVILSHLRAVWTQVDSWSTRSQIVSVLGRLGPMAGEELVKLLSGPDVEIREVTRLINEEAATPVIESLAKHACVSDQKVHEGTDQSDEPLPEDVKRSQAMLRGDTEEQSRALRSLRESGSDVHPGLLKPLVELYASSGSPIAAELLRKAGSRAVGALCGGLWQDDDSARRKLRLLSEIAVGGPIPRIGEPSRKASTAGLSRS
jgi:hypothetical protein